MKELSLSFVITNYNNSNFSIDCAESICKIQNLNNTRIIVVDNASQEIEKDKLAKGLSHFKEVDVLFESDNHGYFRGLNIGLDYLDPIDENSYVIIGNNDLIFQNDFYDEIKKNQDIFSEYPIIAPNIISKEGINQNPHVVKGISNIRLFIYKLYFTNYYVSVLISLLSKISSRFFARRDYTSNNNRQVIRMGYGACYILTPLFFKKFHRLDAPVFLMGEEAILSNQIYSKGNEILYDPNVVVFHEDHATMGKVSSKRIWKISKESYKIYKECLKIKSY